MAIFAGFETVRGQVVVTLDADLQNPPEEVPKLVTKLEEGYRRGQSGWRQKRHDSVLRKIPTWLVAKMTSRVVGVQLKDYGCMLRAYRREVVEAMCASQETSSYIPAPGQPLRGQRWARFPVAHAERAAGGESKYSIFKLIKLNFDLMTGFSVLPIQMVSVLGVLIALMGLAFRHCSCSYAAWWLARRWEGCSPCSPSSLSSWACKSWWWGIMGEYLGRIYREVRRRPRFVIRETKGPRNRVVTMPSHITESEPSAAATRLVLKVDIDTKVGLLSGVPRLMDIFAQCWSEGLVFTSPWGRTTRAALWPAWLSPAFCKSSCAPERPGPTAITTMLYGVALPGPIIAQEAPVSFSAI